MPNKTCRVRLAGAERGDLKALANKGRASARKQTHARILLQCDEGREGGGRIDGEIADALDIGPLRRWRGCAGVASRRASRRR